MYTFLNLEVPKKKCSFYKMVEILNINICLLKISLTFFLTLKSHPQNIPSPPQFFFKIKTDIACRILLLFFLSLLNIIVLLYLTTHYKSQAKQYAHFLVLLPAPLRQYQPATVTSHCIQLLKETAK